MAPYIEIVDDSAFTTFELVWGDGPVEFVEISSAHLGETDFAEWDEVAVEPVIRADDDR